MNYWRLWQVGENESLCLTKKHEYDHIVAVFKCNNNYLSRDWLHAYSQLKRNCVYVIITKKRAHDRTDWQLNCWHYRTITIFCSNRVFVWQFLASRRSFRSSFRRGHPSRDHTNNIIRILRSSVFSPRVSHLCTAEICPSIFSFGRPRAVFGRSSFYFFSPFLSVIFIYKICVFFFDTDLLGGTTRFVAAARTYVCYTAHKSVYTGPHYEAWIVS